MEERAELQRDLERSVAMAAFVRAHPDLPKSLSRRLWFETASLPKERAEMIVEAHERHWRAKAQDFEKDP